MNALAQIADALNESAKKDFPNSYFEAREQNNLCDSAIIWFSKEPKEEWPNSIFHNSRTGIIAAINVKGFRWEKDRPEDKRIFSLEILMNHSPVKIRAKSGSGAAVVKYFLGKIKEIQASANLK